MGQHFTKYCTHFEMITFSISTDTQDYIVLILFLLDDQISNIVCQQTRRVIPSQRSGEYP